MYELSVNIHPSFSTHNIITTSQLLNSSFSTTYDGGRPIISLSSNFFVSCPTDIRKSLTVRVKLAAVAFRRWNEAKKSLLHNRNFTIHWYPTDDYRNLILSCNVTCGIHKNSDISFFRSDSDNGWITSFCIVELKFFIALYDKVMSWLSTRPNLASMAISARKFPSWNSPSRKNSRWLLKGRHITIIVRMMFVIRAGTCLKEEASLRMCFSASSMAVFPTFHH